jgi:L-seryl-tRNA(Ser) seleniumtransferase
MSDNPLRRLPAVDRLLNHLSGSVLLNQYGRSLTVEALRTALDDARQHLLTQGSEAPSDALLIDHARALLEDWLAPTLRPVINATGIIIHTNLGRAPLSDAAIEAVRGAAGGYSTLEYDLESGKRGSRSVHAEVLLQRITGAEAALVVNNNASAVLLALTALARPSAEFPQGRGVIVSRGQLVEIGGGFRMPDVMAQSGARLVEVGTTNRTHLPDYERAISADTGVILRVHRSNFAIVGFTTEPTIEELSTLAKQHNLVSVDDVGSGALLNTADFGLAPEPTVQASLQAGVDLVMFSGDKLLGGPQGGILVGSAAVIDRLKRHPLTRALRPDKLCLAALSATLTHYLKGEALKCVPIWRMISAPLTEIEARARRWAERISEIGLVCEVIEGRSAVGGGSLPGETLPTLLLAVTAASPDAAAARLRAADPPVIARIESDRLLFDPRTVLDREENDLLKALETLNL